MTSEPLPSDAELASRAQQGDRHAFDQLITRHKGNLFRFVRRYVGNEDDAYDLLQDTFISAWRALKRYQLEKSFATWLRAIALNKCRDFGRRRAVRRRLLALFVSDELAGGRDRDPELRSEEDALEAKRLSCLDRAIAELPPFYKDPLLLMTVTGLSQEETADQLNTTRKAIEMRARRGRKKLVEALAKAGFAPEAVEPNDK